jgi:hypothetical protein
MINQHGKKHRKPPKFQVNDRVLLRNALDRQGHTLDAKYSGPFRIIKARHPNYTLDLSKEKFKGHPTFNVDRLERYVEDSTRASTGVTHVPLPAPSQSRDVYNVDHIVTHRLIGQSTKAGQRIEFRVRWEGFDENSDTWEPLRHLIRHGSKPAYLVEYIKTSGLEGLSLR